MNVSDAQLSSSKLVWMQVWIKQVILWRHVEGGKLQGPVSETYQTDQE